METRRYKTNDIGDNHDLPTGMQEKCSELGYRLEIFFRDDYPNVQALERVLLARGIGGLVVGPVYKKVPEQDLNWEHFVAVTAAPGSYCPPIPSVTVNMFGAVTTAWEKVVARGYKRIGAALFEHRLNLLDDEMRYSAVRCCQERLYAKLPNLPIFSYDHETPHEAFLEWVRSNKVEAIVAFNAAVYWQLVKAGVRIPEEVALVDLHISDVNGEIAGILAGGKHSGAELIELVHRGLLANAYGVPKLKVHHVVEPTWVEGASLPDKNKKGDRVEEAKPQRITSISR